MSKSVRWVLRGAMLVVVLLASLWCYGEARQWLLRVRAELLLADVNRLTVRDGTSAQLQEFRRRWNALPDQYSDCTQVDCTLQVMIDSSFVFPGEANTTRQHVMWWLHMRPQAVGVKVGLHDGRIVSKSFIVQVDTWDGELEAVTVESGSLDSDPSEYRSQAFLEHIHHEVRWLQGGMFMTLLTADATSEERKRLWDLRLDCLTSLRSCRKQELSRVAPAAYDEYQREKNAQGQRNQPCLIPFWIDVRDAESVVEADVVGVGRGLDPKYLSWMPEGWWYALRLRRELKGTEPLNRDFQEIEIEPRMRGDIQPEELRGKTVLIAGGADWDGFSPPTVAMAAQGCDVVEETPATLAELQRGLTADFSKEAPKAP